jgi:hypothetical protein
MCRRKKGSRMGLHITIEEKIKIVKLGKLKKLLGIMYD